MTTAKYDPVKGLVAARDNRSVLKFRLLAYRASCAETMIFAFEGDDDKVVFSHWIRRISPDLTFEPFVCGGKRGSKVLSHILYEDENDLKNCVAIFVDRDFDDLDKFAVIPWLFMTDRYAIENYLVDPDVLEQILRDLFPLDGEPEMRASIVTHFRHIYSDFLDITRDANLRLYIAAKQSIPRDPSFAPRLAHLVNFSLYEISKADGDIAGVLPLSREPTKDEITDFEPQFAALEPFSRYRGKFAYMFFRAFLSGLGRACRDGCPKFFGGVPRSNVRESEMGLGGFASKSPLPDCLDHFIQSLPK